MYVDYVFNNQAFGPVAEQLAGCRFDPGLMRPFLDENNRKCVTVNTGKTRWDRDSNRYVPVYKKVLVSDMIANGVPIPVANATSLRKDEWIQLDRVVIKAARQRLRAWADLAAANSFGGFNGMCFTGDTKVLLVDGRELTLLELAEGAAGDDTFSVYSCDSNGRIHAGRATNVRMTGKNVPLVKVTLDNGEEVRCTPSHRFMLRDGSYKEARDLCLGESMMPCRLSQADKDIIYPPIGSGCFSAPAMRPEVLAVGNHKVVSVVEDGTGDVYDLEVSKYHNFALAAGVIVHNSKMILEHETMSDPGEAVVDMDGLTEGRTDAPKFQLEGLPLPITHSDFWFSSRWLAASRNSGTPLDTTMGESAGRRVAEMIEKTLIGTVTGITYGTAADYGRAPTVFGYTNFPDRVTKTNMAAPTGANGTTILTDWLKLRDLLYAQNFYGPFMAYNSTDYDQYLDNLFSTTEPSAGTLRSRLLQIDGISGIRRLDFLTNTFTVLLVQMTPDVARAINGMDITTVQWESSGGMRLDFKVMAIQVPQLRADFSGNSGIAHGTTA